MKLKKYHNYSSSQGQGHEYFLTFQEILELLANRTESYHSNENHDQGGKDHIAIRITDTVFFCRSLNHVYNNSKNSTTRNKAQQTQQQQKRLECNSLPRKNNASLFGRKANDLTAIYSLYGKGRERGEGIPESGSHVQSTRKQDREWSTFGMIQDWYYTSPQGFVTRHSNPSSLTMQQIYDEFSRCRTSLDHTNSLVSIHAHQNNEENVQDVYVVGLTKQADTWKKCDENKAVNALDPNDATNEIKRHRRPNTTKSDLSEMCCITSNGYVWGQAKGSFVNQENDGDVSNIFSIPLDAIQLFHGPFDTENRSFYRVLFYSITNKEGVCSFEINITCPTDSFTVNTLPNTLHRSSGSTLTSSITIIESVQKELKTTTLNLVRHLEDIISNEFLSAIDLKDDETSKPLNSDIQSAPFRVIHLSADFMFDKDQKLWLSNIVDVRIGSQISALPRDFSSLSLVRVSTMDKNNTTHAPNGNILVTNIYEHRTNVESDIRSERINKDSTVEMKENLKIRKSVSSKTDKERRTAKALLDRITLLEVALAKERRIKNETAAVIEEIERRLHEVTSSQGSSIVRKEEKMEQSMSAVLDLQLVINYNKDRLREFTNSDNEAEEGQNCNNESLLRGDEVVILLKNCSEQRVVRGNVFEVGTKGEMKYVDLMVRSSADNEWCAAVDNSNKVPEAANPCQRVIFSDIPSEVIKRHLLTVIFSVIGSRLTNQMFSAFVRLWKNSVFHESVTVAKNLEHDGAFAGKQFFWQMTGLDQHDNLNQTEHTERVADNSMDRKEADWSMREKEMEQRHRLSMSAILEEHRRDIEAIEFKHRDRIESAVRQAEDIMRQRHSLVLDDLERSNRKKEELMILRCTQERDVLLDKVRNECTSQILKQKSHYVEREKILRVKCDEEMVEKLTEMKRKHEIEIIDKLSSAARVYKTECDRMVETLKKQQCQKLDEIEASHERALKINIDRIAETAAAESSKREVSLRKEFAVAIDHALDEQRRSHVSEIGLMQDNYNRLVLDSEAKLKQCEIVYYEKGLKQNEAKFKNDFKKFKDAANEAFERVREATKKELDHVFKPNIVDNEVNDDTVHADKVAANGNFRFQFDCETSAVSNKNMKRIRDKYAEKTSAIIAKVDQLKELAFNDMNKIEDDTFIQLPGALAKKELATIGPTDADMKRCTCSSEDKKMPSLIAYVETQADLLKTQLEREIAHVLDDATVQYDDCIEKLEYDISWTNQQKEVAETNLHKAQGALRRYLQVNERLVIELRNTVIKSAMEKWCIVSKAILAIKHVKNDAFNQVVHISSVLEATESKYKDEVLNLSNRIKRLEDSVLNYRERMTKVYESIMNHKRDVLSQQKLKSQEVALKLENISEKRRTIETQRREFEGQLLALENSVQEVERRLRENSKISVIDAGRVNIAQATRKRRLDEEYEALLESTSRKRGDLAALNDKLILVALEKEKTEDEMRSLEKVLVEILVEQQKLVLYISSNG